MAPSKQKAALTSFLIDEMQSHPSLWNKKASDYKNIHIKCNAWSDILVNLQSSFSEEDLARSHLQTVKDLKDHWRNLRNTYSRKRTEAQGKSGTGLDDVQSKREWPFFRAMQFLDQVLIDLTGSKVFNKLSKISIDKGYFPSKPLS